MLKTLIVSAPITPVMANYIVHYTPASIEWEKPNYRQGSASTRYSRNFIKMGILEVNVWFNTAKMISQPFSTANCLLNVILDAQKITCMDDIIAELYALLPAYPENFLGMFVKDLRFKVKGATFVYNFEGTLIKEYYKLLKGGYDLSQMHLKKEVRESMHKPNYIYTTEYSGVHDTTVPAELDRYSESLHIKMELFMEGKNAKGECPIKYITEYKRADRLHIKFNLKRNKIARICHRLQIDRDPDTFMRKAQKIDSLVFHEYMKHITGEGNYYSFKEAEKIIDSTTQLTPERKLTAKRKNLMKDVLKGVASYKSISTYLDHVEDAEITYPCMESIRKRTRALSLLKDIQSIGICPLNLSVRTKIKELKPLVQIYEEATSSTTRK